MRSFLIISRCSSLVDYSELWDLPIRKNRGSARPEFIQTAVESIDSKVVSKCLTLPEKWGQLSGGSTWAFLVSQNQSGPKHLSNLIEVCNGLYI